MEDVKYHILYWEESWWRLWWGTRFGSLSCGSNGIYYMLNCQIWQESENGWIYLWQYQYGRHNQNVLRPWDWDHETAHCNHHLPQILLEALFNGWREHLQENNVFSTNNEGFPADFPFKQSNDLLLNIPHHPSGRKSPWHLSRDREGAAWTNTHLEGHHSWDWSFRQRARIILCCPTWCFRISWLVLIKRTCGKKSLGGVLAIV